MVPRWPLTTAVKGRREGPPPPPPRRHRWRNKNGGPTKIAALWTFGQGKGREGRQAVISQLAPPAADRETNLSEAH